MDLREKKGYMGRFGMRKLNGDTIIFNIKLKRKYKAEKDTQH